jgi:hypothetical protein
MRPFLSGEYIRLESACGNTGVFGGIVGGKPEGYGQSIVYLLHCLIVKVSHPVFKPPLVYRTDLFKEYNRGFGQTGIGTDFNMGRQTGLTGLAGNRRGYYGGGISVSHVVLNNEYRTYSALFRTYHRGQVGVIYISSPYNIVSCHINHPFTLSSYSRNVIFANNPLFIPPGIKCLGKEMTENSRQNRPINYFS